MVVVTRSRLVILLGWRRQCLGGVCASASSTLSPRRDAVAMVVRVMIHCASCVIILTVVIVVLC